MSKSRNHKWNDDFDDDEVDEKAYRMSQRRDAKATKYRRRDELLSNTEMQEEKR